MDPGEVLLSMSPLQGSQFAAIDPACGVKPVVVFLMPFIELSYLCQPPFWQGLLDPEVLQKPRQVGKQRRELTRCEAGWKME